MVSKVEVVETLACVREALPKGSKLLAGYAFGRLRQRVPLDTPNRYVFSSNPCKQAGGS